MVARDEHRSLALTGEYGGQISAPHRVHGLRNDGAIMRSRSAWSPAPRLNGTPRKRTISAREVNDGRAADSGSASGRRAATARVWRSGARTRRQDVSAAQERGGATAAAWRGP